MLVKKKTPWGSLFLVLIAMLILSYFISGVLMQPDLTRENCLDKILFVLMHPFRWWTPKTPAYMMVALIVWIMFVSYYLDNYRNYQFGKEKGEEQWADIKLLSKTLRDKDETKNTYVSKNIAISSDAVSNQNMIIVGIAGGYKTTSTLVPNLLAAHCTNVFLDIKGELLRKFGDFLKSIGVCVKVINLINRDESDRYNPFVYINCEEDVVTLIKNLQESVKPPDAFKGDPFWEDGVTLYLMSIFNLEWMQSVEEHRKPTMNNILTYVNMESKKVIRGEEETTELQEEMNRLAKIYGDDYPPVRDYRKLKDGATETVRCIVLMVNAMLCLCETPAMKRLLEDDDIDIPSLGLGVDGDPTKKTALFLVFPDNDKSYNFYISMFYTQLFDILIKIADHKCGGSLPIHVRLWADEFYAGPKPSNPEVLMGTIRSRNMSLVPLLQSISQMKVLFPNDKWNILFDNCSVMMFMGAGPGASDTHKYISELTGNMTFDTRNDDRSFGNQGSTRLSNGTDGRELITAGGVRRLGRKQCIVFIEGQYPALDEKNIPFDMPKFKEAEKLAGKNGYKHPVQVVYDKKTRRYTTLSPHKGIQFIDKKDVERFKQMEQTNDNIKVFSMTEEEFLYTNWNVKPRLSEEEILELAQKVKREREIDQMIEKKEQSRYDNINVEKEKNWDLSGNIIEVLEKNAQYLSEEHINQVFGGLQDGLSEEQVKMYITKPVADMKIYRYMLLLANQRREQNKMKN